MSNLLLHSLANFREIILPALEIAGAREIVEVGSEYGTFTQELCAYAQGVNGRLTSIDPAPQPAALDFIAANQGNPHFRFIQAASVDALPKLEAMDACIVDGDHNYFTVRSELELITEKTGAKPILIFEHDVCWPCGRRDMYYNPSAIPQMFRHPYTLHAGVTLDNPGTVEGGFRGEGAFGFARCEGGEANGVRTAIEDFIAERPDFRFEIIPVILGLGVIYNNNAPWAEKISELLRSSTQNPLLPILERNRLELYLKVIELQDLLVSRSHPLASAPACFNLLPELQ